MTTQQIGPYRISEKLGEGRMARVFLATEASNTPRQRTIALKVLRPELIATEVEKLEREARLLKRFDSDFIVRIYGYEKYEQGLDIIHCIAMEYVPGEDLFKLLQKRQRLSIPETIQLSWQVCKALEQAHKIGIVHRDIKPHNIMVNGGHVKVCDFELANIASTSMASMTNIQGTPAYLSPEQSRGEKGDARSDLYSLGVVMYHMLSGRQPFTGVDTSVVIDGHRNKVPQRITNFRADIPEELAFIVHKALEKNVKDRYQSAEEMAARLEALAVRAGIALPNPTKPTLRATLRSVLFDWDAERVRDTVTNLGASAIQGILVILVAAVAGVLGFTWFTGENNPPASPPATPASTSPAIAVNPSVTGVASPTVAAPPTNPPPSPVTPTITPQPTQEATAQPTLAPTIQPTDAPPISPTQLRLRSTFG